MSSGPSHGGSNPTEDEEAPYYVAPDMLDGQQMGTSKIPEDSMLIKWISKQ